MQSVMPYNEWKRNTMRGREEEVLLQEYLGSVLYSIAVFAVWELIMAKFMTRRFSVKTTILLWAAAGLVYFVLPQFILPYGTLLRAFTGFIAYALLQLLLFRDKWYKILFVILMLNAIMMIADIMAVTIGASPEILQNAMETGRQPVFSLANYAICVGVHAVLLWIFVLFLDRYKNRLAPSEWLLYLAFPISQCLLLFGWMDVSRMDLDVSRLALILSAMAVCVVADAALFTVIRGMAQRSALRAQNALLATRIVRQKEHYTALTDQYQAIRRMRHDIASHLYTIELLLNQGKYHEACAYSQEVQAANRYQSQLGSCENPVVDAYLYSRLRELQRDGVSLTVAAELPEHCAVSDMDLIIALGNLLDNAWEASRSAEKPEIHMRAVCQNGGVILETRNTVGAAIREKKRRIPELERGIGFQILQELADKYKGSFVHGQEGPWFLTALILKEETADAAHRHL